jgi:uncharacterized iron-regulated protein
MKKLIVFPLIAICFSFALLKDSVNENNYKIYATKTSKEVKLADIVDEMKNYDVVFFGEEHNDSVAHYLQNELLKGLYASYGDKITLSMEMFETDCQLVLDEYLKGFIREKNFTKEARSWSNYRNYKPMIEFAKEKKINVVAANAPARYANMASRKGLNSLKELSSTAKSFLPPLPYDTATGPYYEKFTNLMSDGRNAGITAKDTSKKVAAPVNSMMPKYILHSQSLWDATMAYSISKVFSKNKKAKVLHLNGRFHSDEGFGAVTQLRKYNPKLRILIISSIDGGANFPNKMDIAENKKLGDFVIFTDPGVPKTFKD